MIEMAARHRLEKFDVAASKIVAGRRCAGHLPLALGAAAALNVDMWIVRMEIVYSPDTHIIPKIYRGK